MWGVIMRKKLNKTIKSVFAAAFAVSILIGCSTNKNNISEEENISNEITDESTEDLEDIGEEYETDSSSNNFVFTPLIAEDSMYGGMNSENGGISYTIKYQSAILDEQTAEVYPELSETLIKDKDFQMKGSEESIEMFRETSGFIKDNSAYAGMELTDEILTSVVRADPAVLSLKKEGYWFNAGAHGNYYTIGVNYDPKTGEKIVLNDVIDNNINKLIATTEKILKENYSETPSNIDLLADILTAAGDDVYGEDDFSYDVGWALGYNQLELYFNPYALGSYAEGQQIVKISFEDYPDLFNEKYTKNIPDTYAYKINNHEDIVYEDIDKDGKNEEIRISMLLDGNGIEDTEEYNLEVSFEDKTYTAQLHSFPGYENYFVKNNNGNCYIYSFTQHDNDYVVLDVCEVTNNVLTVSNSGNLEPAIISYEYLDSEDVDEGEYLTNFTGLKYALTNPVRLELSSRLNALSTYDGYRIYYLNEEGLPVSYNPYITNNGIVLKLKKDFEFEKCYQNGKRTGKKTVIPEGTEFYIHLTDGLSYVVLEYGNNEYVYAEINTNEYPQPVNGVSSEDVFDGMFYAG